MGYRLHWEKRGVIKEFFGLLSGGDILQSQIDVHGSAEFDRLRFVINDFLNVQEIDFGDLDIEYVAALDKAAASTNRDIKVAIVATDQSIIEAARRYAESQLNSYPTRLFSDMISARAWV